MRETVIERYRISRDEEDDSEKEVWMRNLIPFLFLPDRLESADEAERWVQPARF